MPQKIYPSAHTYELFMPLEGSERMMAEVLPALADLGFYHGMETGFFFEQSNIRLVRDTCERNQLSLTMWATPYLLRESLNLNTADKDLRERSVQKALSLVDYAAECGASKLGMPSGDYPGDALCEPCKELLMDSLSRVCRKMEQYPGMHVVLEPLDRYAHKKQLIGPMGETVEWFAKLRQQCDNIFIHWDTAHEALGGIDLIESLDLAQPFMEQLHLCNAITDPSHPMYGDWHMDVGQPPDFGSMGFLTPEIGAEVLKRAASYDTTPGVKATYVAVEMRAHMGDDVWHKEETARKYLARCFELAGF